MYRMVFRWHDRKSERMRTFCDIRVNIVTIEQKKITKDSLSFIFIRFLQLELIFLYHFQFPFVLPLRPSVSEWVRESQNRSNRQRYWWFLCCENLSPFDEAKWYYRDEGNFISFRFTFLCFYLYFFLLLSPFRLLFSLIAPNRSHLLQSSSFYPELRRCRLYSLASDAEGSLLSLLCFFHSTVLVYSLISTQSTSTMRVDSRRTAAKIIKPKKRDRAAAAKKCQKLMRKQMMEFV